MRSVVITGASTGIGFTTAKLLIREGFRVFGSVRNAADAERVSRELGEHFTPLLFDVTDEAAVKKAAGEVRTALQGETLADQGRCVLAGLASGELTPGEGAALLAGLSHLGKLLEVDELQRRLTQLEERVGRSN